MRKATPAATPTPLYVYYTKWRTNDKWQPVATGTDPDMLKDIYMAADRRLHPGIQQKIEKY